MDDPDPLAELEFLARSPNRITVLEELSGGTLTRQELADDLSVSQPTLGRILEDLAERNWVRQTGMEYEATATGEYVAGGVTDLTERLETETRLREVSEWLPTEDVDIGVADLAGATITTPSQTRPNAPIQRMLDLLGDTDTALLLSHAFNGQKLELVRERTVGGDLTTRGVFGEGAIDAIAETPELRDLLVDVVESPAAKIRVTTTDVPAAVEVTDDRTHLLLRDDDGIVRASVDTDDEGVRAWATDLHGEFWDDATPVTPDTLL